MSFFHQRERKFRNFKKKIIICMCKQQSQLLSTEFLWPSSITECIPLQVHTTTTRYTSKIKSAMQKASVQSFSIARQLNLFSLY